MLLTLVDNDNNLSLWSITIPNDDFVMGFLFGFYYGLTKLGKQHEYRFSPTPYDADWTISDTAMALAVPRTYEELMKRYYEFPPYIAETRIAIIVRAPNSKLMYMMYIESASYLQGMFTALQAFNLPITEVLLAQPLLNGTYFNVQGLQLPRVPL